MNSIETKYKIGDLVYTANVDGYDRDVIKAIKVTGLKQTIEYGIKSKNSGGYFDMMFGRNDGYNWYSSKEVFESKEEAENLHNSLKAKDEAKAAEKKAHDRKKRLDDLKREQEALEKGEDFEPDYDDD